MACLDAPLSSYSDETLARLVAAGSDDAFAEIDARYRRRLVRFARSITPAEAEDAVQDAMVRAVRALRRGGTQPDALSPWLHRIVRNCALDLVAAGRRGGVVVELEDHQHPVAEDAQATVLRRQRITGLVHDVGTLPTTQRDALVLRELEGRTYADIADELDVTVPAVKSLLVRARAGLKKAREAAVLFPYPLVARLQQAVEPLTAATTPKLACVACVAAVGTAPVAVPAITDHGPEPAAAKPAAPHQQRAAAAERPAAPAPAAAPQAEASATPEQEPYAVDCVDGFIHQDITRAEALAGIKGLDEGSAAYSGCREAYLEAMTRE